MNTLELEERRPLVFIEGIPARTQDFRWAYQKKLAVYCILASTLFERIAFNSLIANIVLLLKISDDFDWDPSDSATALYIFSGNDQENLKRIHFDHCFFRRNELYLYYYFCCCERCEVG